MKISELIQKLDGLKDQYGDLQVLHHDDWSDFFIEEVRYEEDPPCVVIEGESLRFDEEGEVVSHGD